MSIFIATGSNLGDRRANLLKAKDILSLQFTLICESRIYESPAVDYLKQPDFYNQVLEFFTPVHLHPHQLMQHLLEIERIMGRNREIPKGPRLIDLDLLFWDSIYIETPDLTLPHPRLFTRSFVVLPLSELKGFAELNKYFNFPQQFDNKATPLS